MKLVSIKEVSEYLSIKISTLYSWVHSSMIPYHKLNGLIRFDMEEIEAWIKASRQKQQNTELHIPSRQPQDIDNVVRRAIDSAKGEGYNLSNGKPGQIKVSGRRFHGTV